MAVLRHGSLVGLLFCCCRLFLSNVLSLLNFWDAKSFPSDDIGGLRHDILVGLLFCLRLLLCNVLFSYFFWDAKSNPSLDSGGRLEEASPLITCGFCCLVCISVSYVVSF